MLGRHRFEGLTWPNVRVASPRSGSALTPSVSRVEYRVGKIFDPGLNISAACRWTSTTLNYAAGVQWEARTLFRLCGGHDREVSFTASSCNLPSDPCSRWSTFLKIDKPSKTAGEGKDLVMCK